MGRRRSAKGFGYYVPFALVPLLVVVLTPLLIHASASSHQHVTDIQVYGAFFYMLGISLLSLVGLGVDKACQCGKGFPITFLAFQLFLTFVAAMVGMQMSMPHTLLVPPSQDGLLPVHEEGHLSAKGSSAFLHGPLLSAKVAGTAQKPEQQVLPFQQYKPAQVANPVFVKAAASAASPPSPPAIVAAASPGLGDVVAPVMAAAVPPGWVDAGNGYCEDESKQEYNSLHRHGLSLDGCAQAGLQDPACIFLDFSAADGGCDLRYPADALAQDMDGFEWFGSGAGRGDAFASGKTKHGLDTRCYTKRNRAAPSAGSGGQTRTLTTKLHPYYNSLIREYSFRPVRANTGGYVNIILVHSPLSDKEEALFNKFKDELLFIGIMSLEDFPLPPPNPFSGKWPKDKFVGMFPGFLNMYREPENIFPSHVKVLDMSQSDFSLPGHHAPLPKKWDFTISGSDQDIGDAMVSDCVGWSMFAKNWSFAKQAFEVMCREFDMTGVLVATKDKQGVKRCAIPESCEGKLLQTTYLGQDEFFSYVRQSRFLFLPQVHDASPRVASQALALDVPLLMNKNIIGGWKYVNEKTGEFFNDLSDIRDSIRRLQKNIASGGVYEPRKWVSANYGDNIAGAKFFKWIDEDFKDRVKLPKGTRLLFPIS